MIDRNHPAVEAMLWHDGHYVYDEPPENWPEQSRNSAAADYADKIEHALPHLESATEENLARLRDTPAGKQLLAEGWEAACRKVIHMAWADSSDAEYLADEGNPYRTEAPSDAPEG